LEANSLQKYEEIEFVIRLETKLENSGKLKTENT